MLSERVKVPSPSSSEANAARQPLTHSYQFEEIRKSYEDSSKSYDDDVAAAYAVASLIREAITFSEHTSKQPELSPEWIESGHTTNCHGHSIITSECLDQLGIPHRVSFANQHSFLLMEDDVSGRVNLIDTPVEKLCTDITPALGGFALNEFSRDQGGANFIWGNIILYRSQFGNKQRALKIRPWLSFHAENNGPLFLTDSQNDLESRLILRTYEPEIGREVLLAYDSFMHAVSSRDMSRAQQRLQALSGTYPDIDKRNKLRAPTKLVRYLGSSAFVNEALDNIDAIERSVKAFSGDINLTLWPADQRRDLGAKVKSPDMIRLAIDEYEEAYQRRRDADLTTSGIENRIRRAKNQLGRITS